MKRCAVTSRAQLLRKLRRHCPALLPVRVRFRPLRACWGVTHLCQDSQGRPSHFSISVHNASPLAVMLDTLAHEWGHAVAWQEGKGVTDHGPEWGVAFARIYRVIVDEESSLDNPGDA